MLNINWFLSFLFLSGSFIQPKVFLLFHVQNGPGKWNQIYNERAMYCRFLSCPVENYRLNAVRYLQFGAQTLRIKACFHSNAQHFGRDFWTSIEMTLIHSISFYGLLCLRFSLLSLLFHNISFFFIRTWIIFSFSSLFLDSIFLRPLQPSSSSSSLFF